MRASLLYFLLFICVCQAQPGEEYMGPGLCLDEEDEKLHFVGESCTTDADCYSYMYNSSVCKNGKCACAEDYVAEEQPLTSGKKQMICMNAPGCNMPCNTTCIRPYTCADAPPDENGFGDEPLKICRCLSPYVEKNDFCVLNCTDDEIYLDFKCHKKCAANELVLEDGSCRKMVNLGDACTDSFQCSSAFSECKEGKCACLSGFTPNGDKKCETTAYSCPFGETPKAVVPCSIAKGSKKLPASVTNIFPPGLADTCPEDQYCLLSEPYSFFEGSPGFCCPLPKLTCPVGSPHPTASCNRIPEAEKKDVVVCPTETHTCRQISFGDMGGASVCCPDHCNYRSVHVSGSCHPRRQHGDQCTVNQQCSAFNGICENGKCTCPANFSTMPMGMFTYCMLNCTEDQIDIGGRCVPLRKLDDKCDDPSSPMPCPTNSHCSMRSGTCKCDCGLVRLDGKTCGPPPKCPNPKAISDPFADPLVNVDLSKATFCMVVENDNPPMKNAAKECPAGQYCNAYQPDLGVCCPLPESFRCLNISEVSNKKCDPTVWMDCGDNAYCHHAIDSVGQKDFRDGFVCCTNEIMEFGPSESMILDNAGNEQLNGTVTVRDNE